MSDEAAQLSRHCRNPRLLRTCGKSASEGDEIQRIIRSMSAWELARYMEIGGRLPRVRVPERVEAQAQRRAVIRELWNRAGERRVQIDHLKEMSNG